MKFIFLIKSWKQIVKYILVGSKEAEEFSE